MSRRFQFSLRGLLIIMFGAACFICGRAAERSRYRLEASEVGGGLHSAWTKLKMEELHMPDGTVWRRIIEPRTRHER